MGTAKSVQIIHGKEALGFPHLLKYKSTPEHTNRIAQPLLSLPNPSSLNLPMLPSAETGQQQQIYHLSAQATLPKK